MHRRYLFETTVAAIALTLATTASAQVAKPETLPLTLSDAVQRAVEHNPDLAIVRLGTEVDAARVSQSRGVYSPVFSTTLGGSKNVTPPSNFLLGDRGVDVNDLFSSTGMTQRLPWGAGTWSVSWDTSRTASGGSTSTDSRTTTRRRASASQSRSSARVRSRRSRSSRRSPAG